MKRIEVKGVLADKVLLTLEKSPAVSKGGIFDPRAGERLTPFGKVTAIGPEVTDVAVGDIVYYDIHEGWRIDDDQLVTKVEHLGAKVVVDE